MGITAGSREVPGRKDLSQETSISNNNKSLHLRPALYIPMQTTVVLNIFCIVRKFLAEDWIRSTWSERDRYCFEKRENCCALRNKHDNGGIIIIIIMRYCDNFSAKYWIILTHEPCSLYSLLAKPTHPHTGHTNTGTIPIRASRLYMQPPS